MGKFRPRLTFANVTSVLALFVALGGGAYAATQLPKNSVGTKQLKNGAVTNPKLAANSVGTGKVIDHSLLATDFARGQVGPRQFDVHADEGHFVDLPDLPEVNGVYPRVLCTNAAQIELRAHSPSSQSVGVSGLGEVNGTFEGITAQDQGGHYLLNKFVYSGIAANFDVLARNVQSPNKWTHWVIGLYDDGSGHGCGVWGNVNPPSN